MHLATASDCLLLQPVQRVPLLIPSPILLLLLPPTQPTPLESLPFPLPPPPVPPLLLLLVVLLPPTPLLLLVDAEPEPVCESRPPQLRLKSSPMAESLTGGELPLSVSGESDR